MLTVIVITKNEQDKLGACLESVKWADEILILDNGSIDQTLDIAKKYTSQIFKFENLDFASLRNKAIEKASGEWILYIDADERVLENLRREIEAVINFTDNSAFAISRRNI